MACCGDGGVLQWMVDGRPLIGTGMAESHEEPAPALADPARLSSHYWPWLTSRWEWPRTV